MGIMAISFKRKELKSFYNSGSVQGIRFDHENKFRTILARLDASQTEKDMDLPGLNLHPLGKKGKLDLRGHWAVSVSGNWRVTFRFEGVNAVDVNYIDYH